ncbi:hypothetical protein [Campylobacter fetus]|uniref:hypothetical protein n=1 Tax=Campylobacter fetus TaxID=196 RepID=UPI000FCA53E3|nr:hypothetical protein [Campylobacter fetus]RUT51003.1 hypothetical protein BWK67_00320 [Campylobacter fetus]RUT51731.1 hypothetical protein BWK51_00320 [Campylobacter fetus]
MFEWFINNFTWYHIFRKIAGYDYFINNTNSNLLKKEYGEFISNIPYMLIDRIPYIFITFLIITSIYFIFRKLNNKDLLQGKQYRKTILFILFISFLLGDNLLALPILLILISIVFISTQTIESIKNKFITLYFYSIGLLYVIALLKGYHIL